MLDLLRNELRAARQRFQSQQKVVHLSEQAYDVAEKNGMKSVAEGIYLRLKRQRQALAATAAQVSELDIQIAKIEAGQADLVNDLQKNSEPAPPAPPARGRR